VKPLLVGEMNPYGADPAYALYPLPEGASGHRLQVILGLSRDEYLSWFDRCNLLLGGPRWSAPRAREAASLLKHDRRILLGAKVAAAHGLDLRGHMFQPLSLRRENYLYVKDLRVLVLPHPSGLNRLWNESANIAAAQSAVADFLDDE
jgi:hypothetical protein